MKKIEKREKIILGVMAVIILYGLFTFLPWGAGGKSSLPAAGLSPAELKALSGDLAVAMSKAVLSHRESYAINRAEAGWQRDPFYATKAYMELLKSKEAVRTIPDAAKNITFNYTGYLECGNRRIAIINGVEYAAGEALEVKGYVLRTVTPAKATIEKIDDRVMIKVPMEE